MPGLVEDLKLALGSFAHGKLRTSLSALGIIIGVMSVIAITTLGDSATGSISSSVADAGLNSVTLMIGRDAPDDVYRVFDMDYASEIAALDGVESAVPLVSSSYSVSYGKNRFSDVSVMAALPDFDEIYSYGVDTGSFISADHQDGREAVAVLGAGIAESLFPDGDALGRRIRIMRDQARSFRIVGVMSTMGDTMGMSYDETVYVPASTYDSRLRSIDSVRRYGVSVQADRDVLEVSSGMESHFSELFGSNSAVRVISPASMAQMFTGITETLNLFLSGVAAISLLVGGIGIMNIMLVSVSERTREIGIRKALGASPAVIHRQFLFEAAALTTIGGLLGVAGGLGLSALAIRALGWTFSVNIISVLAAVGFSTAVGIFFGLYPAARAGRLDPVVALSRE